MYEAAQLMIQGYEGCSDNLAVAEKCLAVLAHCSKVDPVARQFYDTVKIYHHTLSSLHARSFGAAGSPTSCEYLFKIPSGSSPLNYAARDLLNLVCRPFGNDAGLSSAAIPLCNLEEINLGVHMDLTLGVSSAHFPLSPNGRSLVLEIMSNMQQNCFMESTEPLGWETTRDSMTLAMQASPDSDTIVTHDSCHDTMAT